MKKRRAGNHDFREHVFTATGKETNLGKFSLIDAYDNITAELDRLKAIAELLDVANDSFDPNTLQGVALLLNDIHRKIRAIMETAIASKKKTKGPG